MKGWLLVTFLFCTVLNILQCAYITWYWEKGAFSFWKKILSESENEKRKKSIFTSTYFFCASFNYTLSLFLPFVLFFFSSFLPCCFLSKELLTSNILEVTSQNSLSYDGIQCHPRTQRNNHWLIFTQLSSV